jgi:outer membrane protein assembly complex protein YaeT
MMASLRAFGLCSVTALLVAALMAALAPAWAADPLAQAVPAAQADKEQGWRILVHGNQALPLAKLLAAAKEELSQFATLGHHVSAIDDAAFQMETLYHRAGFPKAMVDYQVESETRQAIFQVQEGRRLMVRALHLEGNHTLATDRLLDLDPEMRAAVRSRRPFPYVADSVATLVSAIRSHYLAEGFLLAQVRPGAIAPQPGEGDEEVAVTIRIDEGHRFTVGAVQVLGRVPEGLGQAVAAISRSMEGQVYQRRQRLVLKSKLRDSFENAGYAEASVQVDEEVDGKEGRVRLVATVVSGPRVVVDQIRVSGNERTSDAFILSRMRLEPGTQYSLTDRQESFSALYKTGLFSTVDLTLADGPQAERKVVSVTVQERKAREVYVEPGWGSYELLRLKSGYKDSNLFGSGRILRFDSALSAMGRSLEVGVSDPWFLGSDITVGLPFHYRYRIEPTFTMENSGADLYALKTIHKQVQVNLGYQYNKNAVSDVSENAELQAVDTNYHTAALSMQVTRDTRDDMFYPTTGYRGNVALAVARPEFGGTIAYNRLLAGTRYFYPLAKDAVLGLRFNTGVILPVGDQQSIPLGERFFNGGENSVRSFQASELGPKDASGDPLGGTAFTTYSVEWRQKFNEDLAWSLFVDWGNVSPNRTLVDGKSPLGFDSATLARATWRDYFSDLRSGVGAGVQYMLPVGPARLDLALNPNRDAERDEAAYAVHFSVGMAF